MLAWALVLAALGLRGLGFRSSGFVLGSVPGGLVCNN